MDDSNVKNIWMLSSTNFYNDHEINDYIDQTKYHFENCTIIYEVI